METQDFCLVDKGLKCKVFDRSVHLGSIVSFFKITTIQYLHSLIRSINYSKLDYYEPRMRFTNIFFKFYQS